MTEIVVNMVAVILENIVVFIFTLPTGATAGDDLGMVPSSSAKLVTHSLR